MKKRSRRQMSFCVGSTLCLEGAGTLVCGRAKRHRCDARGKTCHENYFLGTWNTSLALGVRRFVNTLGYGHQPFNLYGKSLPSSINITHIHAHTHAQNRSFKPQARDNLELFLNATFGSQTDPNPPP
eukprot:6467795-Amphidinium_carterae.5